MRRGGPRQLVDKQTMLGNAGGVVFSPEWLACCRLLQHWSGNGCGSGEKGEQPPPSLPLSPTASTREVMRGEGEKDVKLVPVPCGSILCAWWGKDSWYDVKREGGSPARPPLPTFLSLPSTQNTLCALLCAVRCCCCCLAHASSPSLNSDSTSSHCSASLCRVYVLTPRAAPLLLIPSLREFESSPSVFHTFSEGAEQPS